MSASSRFDAIYAGDAETAAALAALLPPDQGEPRVARLASTAFLTGAVLSRLEAHCRARAPAPRVLDLGCGRGRLGAHLARVAGGGLIGVDLAAAALAAAPHDGASFVRGDLACLPFADASFPLVLAIDSLHLAADLDATLREVCRVLAPGGAIVATTYEIAASDAPPRPADAWRRALTDAGLRLESWCDTTAEWRAAMRARHLRRWEARGELLARLGARAIPCCSVSRQMLGEDGRPGFIDRNHRWELVATLSG